MNRMPASESLFKESMGILKANDGSQFAYASSLNNLANIYRLGGDAAKAVPLYEEARATFAKKAGEFSAEYATTTFNLGQTFYKINDPRAKTELEKALKYRTDLFGQRHPKYGEATRRLASYWWQQNDFFTGFPFL